MIAVVAEKSTSPTDDNAADIEGATVVSEQLDNGAPTSPVSISWETLASQATRGNRCYAVYTGRMTGYANIFIFCVP